MTAKELAEMLSGREVGMEITPGETQDAKNAGLVVVYGCSDDNVEICGAINSVIRDGYPCYRDIALKGAGT